MNALFSLPRRNLQPVHEPRHEPRHSRRYIRDHAGIPGALAPQEPGQAPAEDAATTEALAPLRATLAGVAPEPPAPDALQRVLDGLRNLPEPPRAWLVYVMPDGTRLRYPLGLAPVYKGATVTRDGRPMAGRYLGTSGDGYILLEATSAAWCEDDITAGMAQRDALAAAAGEDEAQEGGEAA